MATSLGTVTSYAVRRAGIVDVTHVARLLEASAPELDIDGDGTVDGPADPLVAASVTRLALSHVVLQHGQLWVADAGDSLHAATVWMPLGAVGLADDLRDTVVRELDAATVQAAIDPGEEVRQALAAAAPEVAAALDRVQPDVVLTALAAVPELPAAERDRLLQACIATALEEIEGVAAAVTLVPERVAVLEAAGFTRVDEVEVGAGHLLWVGRAA
ncbi:hypothetical protein [Mumia sp. DW29H23]|uniref:hypothetical protein n=1 Tax=Mumia sp. DW29H23 TaxID=3421241 RepID=UPI003D68676B